MKPAGILVLSAFYLALSGGGGAFSSLLQLLFLWAAVAVECMRDRRGRVAAISFVLTAAIASTALLALTSLPALVCLLPAAITVVALSDRTRALNVLPGCLFGSSMLMALTVKLGSSAQVIAAADAGTLLSLCLFFGVALYCYRGATTRSHWFALAGISVATVLLSESTPSLIAVSASALVAGWTYLSAATFGEPRPWRICALVVTTVVWWLPYARWHMKPSAVVTATLLPAQLALEDTPFAQTASALRARFPGMQIWHDVGSWAESTTLFIPWTGQGDWTPDFWHNVASRADETHSHLVVLGEHTDLGDIRSRLAPVLERYDLRFGDDTTTPRPNRDLLGRVWNLGVSNWPPDLALNRGASVRVLGVTARPAVVGRDWFADAPGWKDSFARLGDGRATRGERFSDVVLVAHGLSPTRRSVLTLVADNSAFVDFNAVVQPAVVFESLASGPEPMARWDLFLCVLAIGGVIARTTAWRTNIVTSGVAVLLLAFPQATMLERGPVRFLENPTPLHGYGSKNSSEFRLWWLARSGSGDFDQVVLNDWRQLGSACEDDAGTKRIVYFGVPGNEPACGVVPRDVFRFGSLSLEVSGAQILVTDGAWADLSQLDGKPVRVLVGEDSRALAARWCYRGNEITAWFDAGVITEDPSASSVAALKHVLTAEDGDSDLHRKTCP